MNKQVNLNKSKKYYIGDPYYGMSIQLKQDWKNRNFEDGIFFLDDNIYIIQGIGDNELNTNINNLCLDSNCIGIFSEDIMTKDKEKLNECLQFGTIIDGPLKVDFISKDKMIVKNSKDEILCSIE